MDPAVTILVIEDEPPIRRFLRATLSSHGYKPIESATAQEGLAQAATWVPDLIILDLGLPDLDGVEVARRLREWTTVPIIVLSVRDREQDKIAALDAGADDYLTKPFGVGELLARIRVALRHLAQLAPEPGDPIFTAGDLQVDLSRRQVLVNGNEVHLTPIEYKLLTVLIRHAEKVMTHQQLLKEVWGPACTDATHYVRVYMGQLRHKLEADPARPRYLITEPGIGYRLKVE
jgi:two-component system KDP operon response regulator KdpE